MVSLGRLEKWFKNILYKILLPFGPIRYSVFMPDFRDPIACERDDDALIRFLYHEFKTPTFVFKSLLEGVANGDDLSGEDIALLRREVDSFNAKIEAVLETPPGQLSIETLRDITGKNCCIDPSH
jgi:hypothetical protein